MVALAGARNTPEVIGPIRNFPIAAATTIYAGALVQLNAAGFLVPASATAANIAVGRADETVVNAGEAGAASVDVRRGIFRFANSAAGDLIARSEIGKTVYVVDDQTVAKTNNAGARPAAGICFDVDAQGVWVEF
ncbi:MAG: hypothetical protein IT472_08860 [Thermomonas sp.]|uniref:hypothetical protein n=1 Tax=Thermomonas sp. TaxID=1971895 RepID=UPI0026292017|nr:hypothetical protein [Thermomonas sp.]MCC7097275.1 hypothetical protein [Thermomonas sp.]